MIFRTVFCVCYSVRGLCCERGPRYPRGDIGQQGDTGPRGQTQFVYGNT